MTLHTVKSSWAIITADCLEDFSAYSYYENFKFYVLQAVEITTLTLYWFKYFFVLKESPKEIFHRLQIKQITIIC